MRKIKLLEVHYHTSWPDFGGDSVTEIIKSDSSQWVEVSDEDFKILLEWSKQSDYHSFKRFLIEDKALDVQSIISETLKTKEEIEEREKTTLEKKKKREEKRRLFAEANKEKKRLQEIEKAKKILEKHGELK